MGFTKSVLLFSPINEGRDKINHLLSNLDLLEKFNLSTCIALQHTSSLSIILLTNKQTKIITPLGEVNIVLVYICLHILCVSDHGLFTYRTGHITSKDHNLVL